jgi:hypothetical protein
LHQPAVANYISGKNSGEPPLDVVFGHTKDLPLKNAAPVILLVLLGGVYRARLPLKGNSTSPGNSRAASALAMIVAIGYAVANRRVAPHASVSTNLPKAPAAFMAVPRIVGAVSQAVRRVASSHLGLAAQQPPAARGHGVFPA